LHLSFGIMVIVPIRLKAGASGAASRKGPNKSLPPPTFLVTNPMQR
jgi:hypothetical protein